MRYPKKCTSALRPRWLVVGLGLALFGAACSSSESMVESSAEEGSVTTPLAELAESSVEATSTTPEVEEMTTESTAPDVPVNLDFPSSTDVCTTPANHRIGEQFEYEFEFADKARPVWVDVPSQEALSRPVILVGLHEGQGRSSGMADRMRVWLSDLMSDFAAPEDQIVVAPKANSAGLWTETVDFNAGYLTQLFEHLQESFCFDDATVVLYGAGQGSFAATQAICTVGLPVDLLVTVTGIIMLEDCEPPVGVPMLTMNAFGTGNILFGPEWDSVEWTPPGKLERELLLDGSIAPQKHLAAWSEFCGCESEPDVVVVPDPDDLLANDTLIMTYRGCLAPMVNVVHQAIPGALRLSDDVMAEAAVLIRAEIAQLLRN